MLLIAQDLCVQSRFLNMREGRKRTWARAGDEAVSLWESRHVVGRSDRKPVRNFFSWHDGGS